jgi:voltage-gated potassium channel
MRLRHHLIFSIILFLLVIGFGAYAYHIVEGWRILDSVYFVVVTITTIGYGDLIPITDLGKIFTIFFSFFGIAMAFYIIGIISSNLLKKHVSHKENQLRYYLNKKKKEEIEETKKRVRAGFKASKKRKKKKLGKKRNKKKK